METVSISRATWPVAGLISMAFLSRGHRFRSKPVPCLNFESGKGPGQRVPVGLIATELGPTAAGKGEPVNGWERPGARINRVARNVIGKELRHMGKLAAVGVQRHRVGRRPCSKCYTWDGRQDAGCRIDWRTPKRCCRQNFPIVKLAVRVHRH
jgi:hypothetical protein